MRVALVCMPFASAARPSIQVGLLSALAERAGFSTEAFHFNLDLAVRLSPELYETLCQHRGRMTGDWLFAPAAFGAKAPRDEDAYFQAFPEEAGWLSDIGKNKDFVACLRQTLLPQFVDCCFESTDWSSFGIVGFTSTFQQHTASLALARRIKETYPSVPIVFGGANLESEMGRESARAFPYIDYVVSGEGDLAFPALLRRIDQENTDSEPLLGVIARRSDGELDGHQAPAFHNLDALPTPNYSPYFERAKTIGLLPSYQTTWTIPFESSRGCWWGQKHHCTFCGLNGTGMTYRRKSPPRLMQELAELSNRHQISAFTAVDNILEPKYITDLFAQLAESKTDYVFFYELKANLNRQQIQTLHRGGIRHVQPGIESMSTHVLQLMRKGCSMLQNVRCLKWCLYYGIRVDWNLIWGFPGETSEDYADEREILNAITHFEPPTSASRIWLERFSPYYTDRLTFPVRNVRPEASYQFVYPADVDLDKIAYFFDYDMGNTIPAEAHRETEAMVERWQKSWHSAERHSLSYRRTRDRLLVDFNWGSQRQGTYELADAPALIYEYCCETMRSVDDVVRYLRGVPCSYEYAEDDVREALDDFCRARLMVGESDKYLALAIPSNPNW